MEPTKGSDTMARNTGKINAFFYRNRNKGVRNLMLYVAGGNVLVWVLSMLNPENLLFFNILRFDYLKIMGGQVWRLFSYPLTYLTQMVFGYGGSMMGILLGAISMFFYYFCGRVIENNWGVLRFNLYYLAGVLLTDLAGIVIGLFGRAADPVTGNLVAAVGTALNPTAANYAVTASYVNLSLFLALATLQPELGVRVYFFIPVKMKWLAWLELGLTVYNIVVLLIRNGFLSLLWIMPIFALLNYFLFFGKSFVNVLPDFMRHPKNRTQRQTAQRFRSATQSRGPTYTAPNHSAVHSTPSYRFRCTVCGRTDVSNPGLEFRYCSKCSGYRCYCADHINNHVHVSE